jgi:hypothetical protein
MGLWWTEHNGKMLWHFKLNDNGTRMRRFLRPFAQRPLSRLPVLFSVTRAHYSSAPPPYNKFSPDSTDVVYASYTPEEILTLQKALGFRYHWSITTYCPKPDRTLLHCCLVAIGCGLIFRELDEIGRGRAIAELANKIFAKVKPDFIAALEAGKLAGMKKTLAEKHQKEETFFNQFLTMKHHLNPYKGSQLLTPTAKNRDEIIKYHLKIKERIQNGEYVLKDGESAASLTWCWYKTLIEYRHMRSIGSKLVNAYIKNNIPADQKLTLFPKNGLVGDIVCAPMGGGKTFFTIKDLKRKHKEERYDLVINDADYLKKALGSSGTQAESSNVAFKMTQQRHYNALITKKSPKVVANSVSINPEAVAEMLSGGGKIQIHHISIDPQEAIDACKARAKIIVRDPPTDAIIGSNVASTRSVLDAITRYKGEEVSMEIMERKGNTFHQLAVISCKGATLHIFNMLGFLRVTERAQLGTTPTDSWLLFTKSIASAGYTVTVDVSPRQNWTAFFPAQRLLSQSSAGPVNMLTQTCRPE